MHDFFGILEDTGKLEYINAGHPSPILLRKETTQEAFTEGSFPVGLVRKPSSLLLLCNWSPTIRWFFSAMA